MFVCFFYLLHSVSVFHQRHRPATGAQRFYKATVFSVFGPLVYAGIRQDLLQMSVTLKPERIEISTTR